MENRKVTVRIIKKTAKRFEKRLEERKQNKKPSKKELLEKEGLAFFTFVLDIEKTSKWCEACHAAGIKPTERIKMLIEGDIV